MESCNLPRTSQKLYSKFYSAEQGKAKKEQGKAVNKIDWSSFTKSTKSIQRLSGKLGDTNISLKVNQFIIGVAKEIKTF